MSGRYWNFQALTQKLSTQYVERFIQPLGQEPAPVASAPAA